MMKREKTSPWKKIAALAVLPLCGAFIALSATPNYVMEEPTTMFSTIEVENANVDAVATNISKVTPNDTSTVVIRFVPPVKKNPNQKNFFSVAEIRKDTEGVKENPLIYIDGKESSIENFEKTNTYEIESLTIYRVGGEAIKKYGDKGKDGVISITTKGYKKADGKTPPPPVKATKKEGVGLIATPSSKEPTKDYTIRFDAPNTGRKNWTFLKVNGESFSSINPLILLDSKEISKKEVEAIKYNDIESISVYKSDTPEAKKYGDKAKDGLINITTKGSDKPSKAIANSNVSVRDNSQVADDDLKDAIYVIDNQLSTAKSFAQIPKDNLESISILKDAESLRDQLELYYPVLAKQSIAKGVIIVTTKEKSILDGISPNVYVVLNGKEVSRDDLGKVDPKDITNIDVFKPGNAKLLEYGDKAKDGAILITTM